MRLASDRAPMVGRALIQNVWRGVRLEAGRASIALAMNGWRQRTSGVT
jgi:hypothetical protein